MHGLEHAMGAIDPRISHGAGLGVAFPAFVRANAERGLRLNTYNRMAKEIYGKEGWQGLCEGWKDMLKSWNHPTTLDELFGRPATQADRDELLRVFMLKPGVPEDLIRDAYKYM